MLVLAGKGTRTAAAGKERGQMETGLFPQWRSGEREILPIEPPERQTGKLRVAAYARVSTDMADQLN